MKDILKLFKKLLIPILVCVVMLFIQARLELKLPDYTANIVNTGIQQNGIDVAVYKEISLSSMNKLLLFTDQDEEILNNYHLITRTKKNLNKYKLLKDEDIYALNKNVDLNKMEKVLEDPIFIKSFIDNADKNDNFQKFFPVEDGVNVEALYILFEGFNDDELKEFNKTFETYISNVSSSIKKQGNISAIVSEYKKIGINTDKRQMNYLLNSGIKMLAIALFIMIIAIIVSYLSSYVGAKFSHDLREKLVKKIMSFSNQEYEEFSTASLITRTTNDVQQVQMLLIFILRIVIFAPILGIGALLKVWGSSLSWIIGLAVLLIFVVMITLFAIAFPKFKLIQKIIDRLNLVSREIISGIPVIRAFANEKYEEKRFDKANKDLTRINLFVNNVMVFMMPFMSFILNTISVLIVWVGAKSVDMGSLQVGDLMAFITYAIQIIISFVMISMISIVLPRAIVSLKRIAEVLNKESSIKDPKNVTKLDTQNGCVVSFNNVSFRYPDAKENVLDNISFIAKPNTVTAIIGSTGCGKSTLVNLIPRFFDVSEGSITINDVDIRNTTLQNLRENIGYVPQKGYLFTGTIESNIKFSVKDISDEDMLRAAKISQASEFINKKKNKYDEQISEGGTNISGGQKQRIAIARALAFKPRILIFDDSFSAVDYKTDAKLRSSIKSNVKDATTLIVAQRISTILDADQIIVLESGKIVGIGTHKKLMKKCKVYKEIALSQLSEEELL